MANKVTLPNEPEIDVLNKYNELIKENLGSESVYIRTKETLQDLFETSSMKANEQAQVIAQVLSSLNNSLVSSSMQTALAWAGKEKDNEFAKLELEYKLAMLDAQVAQAKQQEKSEFMTTARGKAELLKHYGVVVSADGIVSDAGTDGKIDKEITVLDREATNKTYEGNLLIKKVDESNVTIHKAIADTFTNYGSFTYDVGENGVSGVTKTSSGKTLSDWQMYVAAEQSRGYAYNAWTNAAQSSAGMIGTLLTSDIDSLSNTDINTYMNAWFTFMTKLNQINPPTGLMAEVPITAPKISAIGYSSASDNFLTGNIIELVVTFDTNVVVIGADLPTIGLTIGTITRTMEYYSGKGTPALTFRYTAVAADVDSDGITIGATPITIAAGSGLYGVNGLAADLTYAGTLPVRTVNKVA